MGAIKKLLDKIEKKYAWGFFGTMLAIATTAWAVYVEYYKDNSPKLEYLVETNTKVLDLKENVRKLDIIYQGENIKENHKNLSVIKLRVYNPSNTCITLNLYDLREPLGFQVKGGEIVDKPEIVESSSDYIKKELTFKIDSPGVVTFNPIIIEDEDYFTFKLLVLHKEQETPKIISLGKIAGIKKIPVIDVYKSSGKKSFWSELTDGNFWIQLVRLLFYGLCLNIVAILVLILIYLPFSWVFRNIKQVRRKRKIRKYEPKNGIKSDQDHNFIFETYLKEEIVGVVKIQNLVSDHELFKNAWEIYIQESTVGKERKDILDMSADEILANLEENKASPEITAKVDAHWRAYGYRELIHELLNGKVLEYSHGVAKLKDGFKEKLDDFIAFVQYG